MPAWGGPDGGLAAGWDEGEVCTRDSSPLPVHPGRLSLTFASQASSWRALPGDLSLNCSHQAEKSHPCVSDSCTLMKMWFLRGK